MSSMKPSIDDASITSCAAVPIGRRGCDDSKLLTANAFIGFALLIDPLKASPLHQFTLWLRAIIEPPNGSRNRVSGECQIGIGITEFYFAAATLADGILAIGAY
jgi:hypothetical protein